MLAIAFVKDSSFDVHLWANRYVASVYERLQPLIQQRNEQLSHKLSKVLDAFKSEKVCSQHFSSSTGYGHHDEGREVIDRVFARVLNAQKASVRLQIVSGTHAISAALFGVLRPGDSLLSVTGSPYETLEEVIGIRGHGAGSLKDFGVLYNELPLAKNGNIDLFALEKILENPIKMVFIQRSCGYSWRKSISIDQIELICNLIHQKSPNTICFVDNCYGEFVERIEPCGVGADLIAGSLIKNLGGTIVPTGGYIAGRSDLVELASSRVTAPGIGSTGGITFDLNRQVLQGLFLAPQMVTESLIGADLVRDVFKGLGFKVNPSSEQDRVDIIQSVCLGSPQALKVVCKAFQESSPIGSYLEPIPAPMPGYESDLLMAGGTFIDGSTSEFSADAPLREPYNLFVQGGSHHEHVKIALIQALVALEKAKLIKINHNI